MNILLIRPRPHSESVGLMQLMICEPIELEYVSSYMEQKGHQTEIVDMILDKRSIEDVIKAHKPSIVGITGYISHVNVVKQYAEEIKKVDPACTVVVGGVHAEVVAEDFHDKNIDFIIRANALKTFGEIVDNIENNSNAHIDGVWGKDKREYVIDTAFKFPFPDCSKTKKYRHRYDYLFHVPCALMKTSFGCPYNCSFCYCIEITQRNYFERDLPEVIEEIKTIEEKEIFIVDDNFLFSRERVLSFCRLLKEHNINKKFIIFGRADFIVHNEDVIRDFSGCGLAAVFVGLESFKSSELQSLNKKTTTQINEEAVAILNRYNVDCYGGMIIGPDWGEEDFDCLVEWMHKIDLKFVNLDPLTPLPGTQIFQQYQDQLLIPRNEHEKWDLAHLVLRPTRLSARQFYWNLLKAYYRTTSSFSTVCYIFKKFVWKIGFKAVKGGSRVTWHYIKLVLKGSSL